MSSTGRVYQLYSQLSSLLRTLGSSLDFYRKLVERGETSSNRYYDTLSRIENITERIESIREEIATFPEGETRLARNTRENLDRYLSAAIQVLGVNESTPSDSVTPEGANETAIDIENTARDLEELEDVSNINPQPSDNELERNRKGRLIMEKFRRLSNLYLDENVPYGTLLMNPYNINTRQRQRRLTEYINDLDWSVSFYNIANDTRRHAEHQRMLERIFMLFPRLPVSPQDPRERQGIKMVYTDAQGHGHIVTFLLNAEKIAVVLETMLQYAEGNRRPVNVFSKLPGSDTGVQLLNEERLLYVESGPYYALLEKPLPRPLLNYMTQKHIVTNNEQIVQEPAPKKTPIRVGFFNFFVDMKLNLLDFQVASSGEDYIKYKHVFETNCLVWALKQSGIFTEQQLEEIYLQHNKRKVSMVDIKSITEKNGFVVRLSRPFDSDKRKTQIIGDKHSSRIVRLGLINDHVFIVKKIPCTSYYIKHFQEIMNWNKIYNKPLDYIQHIYGKHRGEYISGGTEREIDSYKALRLIMELYSTGVNFVRPVMLSDVVSLDLSLHRAVSKDREYLGPLEYIDDRCLQSFRRGKTGQAISFEARKTWESTFYKEIQIFYADFETFTVDNDKNPLPQHIPFMVCLAIEDETDNEIYTFSGKECGEEMLEFIEKLMDTKYKTKIPLIYFHNLGYDINFLAQYGIHASLPRGRRMLSGEIEFHNRIYTFKDSLSLIPAPLSAFGRMFGLTVEKEIFPYNFYTEERYYGGSWPTIEELFNFMGEEWSDEDKDHVMEICRQLGWPVFFPMFQFAQYYCQRDVAVLRAGLRVFRQGIWDDFNLDTVDFLSISSIANAIFEKNIYSKIPKLYKVGGIVRAFLQRAIHGGRVMCCENKKWKYIAEGADGLVDFDAVSLYPSAMSRLWLVTGKPEVFSEDDLVQFKTNRNKYSAYVIDICITKVGKKRQFPLIIGKNPNTGSVLNTNEEGIIMTVCDIELEDLITFQEIDYIPLRGYYWLGDKIYTIQDEIKTIFNRRLEYKKQKNPLETIYKLIMNSIYGKTILKPIPFKLTYKRNNSDEYRSFVVNNSSDIDYIENIFNSNIMVIKHGVSIEKHFNFSLFGIHILAMSKRIMNEVMTLAEDLGLRIYYQDTDSMHIERQGLSILATEFAKKYNRPLIGTNLGQFHPDFDLFPDSENVQAIESYFIGKKCYLDKLVDSQGRTGWHVRLKGIPKAAIEELAEREYNNDLGALYNDLYEGKALTFNLLARGKVAFQFTKGMTVNSKEEFNRTVCFNK